VQQEPYKSPKAALLKRFSAGELHHGLIFQGEPISSIEREAHDLSSVLLGMAEGAQEHPDLFHLRPTGKMRIITVEKTRGLISELYRTSNQGGAKVALIHEADRMRKEAANAFLKTLEEPPPDTYLILLTTRPNSMLPTIRSRCLSVRFGIHYQPREEEDWIEWKENYEKWILSLLDRSSLANDRVTPIFAAYGLTSGLLKIIREKSEAECKAAIKALTTEMEDKEKDAFETGVRKSIRSQFLREVSEVTRSVVVKLGKTPETMSKLSNRFARVIDNLEKNTGLLEVNLKDEAALEDFYLSSLRIWSAK
jgi:DNA polymerase-3 subunit delta'